MSTQMSLPAREIKEGDVIDHPHAGMMKITMVRPHGVGMFRFDYTDNLENETHAYVPDNDYPFTVIR